MIIIEKEFAPIIARELKSVIEGLDNPEDYVLSLQFDYRDNNTLFYLEKVEVIEFQDMLFKISQKNVGKWCRFFRENPKLDHSFIALPKINSKCIKGLNVEDI